MAHLAVLALAVLSVAVSAVSADEDAHPLALNVLDFGAKGDGESDDTAAFQKAIDAAFDAGGAVVRVPRGNFRLNGSIVVKDRVVVKGIWETPTARSEMKGSTLVAYGGRGKEDGDPLITLNTNGTLKGLTIFYPEQTRTPPVPYPWTIRGIGDNCTIRDVLIVNPWQAVDFGTFPAGRHYISGLYAQPLKTGIFIDKCFDVGRVENVHIWPFWDAGETMMKWHQENTTAFIIGRTDWEYMYNCFTIWCKIGYRFVANADGPGNAVLTQCGADIGPTAVMVESVQHHSGVSFQNGQFMAGIEVKPTNTGPVKFTGCGFWGVAGMTGPHARLEGGGQYSFVNCHFISWDQKASGSAAIEALTGGLTVTGCDFMEVDRQEILLGEGVKAATIVANRFRGGQKIDNNSKGSVEIGLNAKE